MKRTNIHLYIFILFVFFSCRNVTEESDNNQGVLLAFNNLKSSEISLPSGIKNINESFQPFESNNIYFLSQETGSFFRLNLISTTFDSLSIINDTIYSEGFTVNEQKEEIYIFSNNSMITYNFKGESQDTFNLENKCNDDSYLVVLSQQFLPDIYQNKLYIHSFPNIEETYQSSEYFTKLVLKSIDLNTTNCRDMEVYYPMNYKNNCYGMNYIPEKIQLNKSKDYKFGMSYAYNDSLFVYNLKSKKNEKYFFGSRLKNPKFKYLNFNKIKEYNQIVFDKLYAENNQYLFSKAFPLAGYISRSLLIKGETQKEIVCLFDNNFNYIGESDGIWKSKILFDSSEGIKSLSIKNKHMIINTLTWSTN